MKKFISVLAAVLLVVVVSAPVFADQPIKGPEGNGTRLKANSQVAADQPIKGPEGNGTRLKS